MQDGETVLSLFQVFRTDECVCVYTLHGHADSISCLSVDKVRYIYKIKHNVMQMSCNNNMFSLVLLYGLT